MTISVSIRWHAAKDRNGRPPTIWQALAERLGREPTNAEAAAEVQRILRGEAP